MISNDFLLFVLHLITFLQNAISRQKSKQKTQRNIAIDQKCKKK